MQKAGLFGLRSTNHTYESDSESEAPPVLPKKKAKVPLRFVVPADKPSEDEPPQKKPKFSFAAASKSSGLAALLPPPSKNPLNLPPPTAKPVIAAPVNPFSDPILDSLKNSLAPPKDLITDDDNLPRKAANSAPTTDFFGISNITSAPSSSLTKRADTKLCSAPSLPKPQIEKPPSKFGDPPTKDDPYPGFKLVDGQWVAKDKESYDAWLKSYSDQFASPDTMPKEFQGIARAEADGVRKVDGAKEKEEWARLEALKKEVRGGAELKVARDGPVIAERQISRAAKGKHQLSSLLQDVRANREELEERIAKAKQNRKSAGAKYGF